MIGAGSAGTFAANHLLRRGRSRVVLIDPGGASLGVATLQLAARFGEQVRLQVVRALVRTLLASGRVRSDEPGAGIATSPNAALVDRDGARSTPQREAARREEYRGRRGEDRPLPGRLGLCTTT